MSGSGYGYNESWGSIQELVLKRVDYPYYKLERTFSFLLGVSEESEMATTAAVETNDEELRD